MEYRSENPAPAERESARREDFASSRTAAGGSAVPANRAFYFFVKRGFDILLSGLALAALCPLFLVVALVIKAEDGGPVFYHHVRIGKNRRPISIHKFRTMQVNADHLSDSLTPEERSQYKKEFKLNHDPRITRAGAFLRRSSIDELPQLVNILLGQMSVVGPRPLMQEELEEKYTPCQQALLLSVRPGLTGLWQVNGRGDCTYESGQRQKLELAYVRGASLGMDLRILWKTAGVVLKGDGAR